MPVLPQVLVSQELSVIPTELVRPLRAFVFGPEYQLHRYNTAEKALVGSYSPVLGNSFAWLGDLERLAGSTIDQSYTKVYLENALLKYWDDQAGANVDGSVYDAPDALLIYTPEDVPNKLFFTDTNLVDKTGYALDAAFNDRDVQVGDVVQVQGLVGGVVYEAEAEVTGFEAEDTASAIGTAAPVSTNKATQIASAASETTVVGTVDVVASGTYDGLGVGVLNETYTITVRKGTIGQNPSSAIIDIVSASGEDSVLGYVPVTTTYAQDIPLGANGLNFQFNATTEDLVIGWQWTVEVSQAFTKPVATTAGTFIGTFDTTYLVTVIRGGDKTAVAADDRPKVQITTTTGRDSAAPVVVGAAAINIGNYGVTLSWDQDSLCEGDSYSVSVTAAGEGAIRTLVLNRSLPAELVSTSTFQIDLSVNLCIQRDIELHSDIFDESLVNWTQDADTLTLNDAAREFDSTWGDGETSLPVVGGDIYVHWRELVSAHTDRVYSVGSVTELADEFDTPVDPDNPLVYAINKALANSNGTIVRAMAVASDDLTGYTAVLNAAENRDDIYSFVPLTFDRTIQDAVSSHVTTMSSAEYGLWRAAIVCSEELNPNPVAVENSDESLVLATTTSDRYLDLDTSSDLELITLGVEVGDVVRINFDQDKYGVETYEQYTVDQVVSETRLRLVTTPSPVVSVASRMEIWRSQSDSDTVEQITGKAGSFASRRVVNVYPSEVVSAGVTVPGYHAAAAVAGLTSGVAPHQGLTNVELLGFDHMDGVVDRFNRSQLEELSDAGVWILTHERGTNRVHTRHALTTDNTDLNRREQMITKNLDSCSYLFRSRLAAYIGRANVTPTMLSVLRTQINGAIAYLRTSSFSDLIGGQLIDGSIRTLRPHALLKDRIVVVLDLDMPYPINNIELSLVV